MNLVNDSLDILSREKKAAGHLARHSITRNSELAIQLLYTHLTEYLRSIIGEIYDQKPLEIVGKINASLSFPEIVKLGTYEALRTHMIEHVFKTLENQRSTKTLIEKILDKTGVTINQKTFSDAMFYLEVRHLIVHNLSTFDYKFVESYKERFTYVQVGKKFPYQSV